jgi:hypothetical protein
MLGWLILFTFLTGCFVGSTALLGAMLLLSKDPKTKKNLEEFERKLDDDHFEPNILKY